MNGETDKLPTRFVRASLLEAFISHFAYNSKYFPNVIMNLTSPPLLGHWLISWFCQWRPFASAMAGLCQKSNLTNCWKHVRWCVLLEICYASLHLVKPHLFLSKPSHLCCRHCQKAYILSLRPSNSINYEFRPRYHSHAFFPLPFVCLFTSVLSLWCLWIIFFKRNVNEKFESN